MRPPVAAYMLVITTMVTLAAGAVGHGAPPMLLAGAVIFYASDLSVARDKFVAPGFDKVRIAGEPERETRARREREGIAIDDNTWQEIVAAGAKLNVDAATLDRLASGGSM